MESRFIHRYWIGIYHQTSFFIYFVLCQLWRLHSKRMYENIKIVERRPSSSLDICSILNAPLQSSFNATRKTDAKVPFPIKHFILSIFLFVSRHFLIVSKWNAFTFIIYLYRSKGFFIHSPLKLRLILSSLYELFQNF